MVSLVKWQCGTILIHTSDPLINQEKLLGGSYSLINGMAPTRFHTENPLAVDPTINRGRGQRLIST